MRVRRIAELKRTQAQMLTDMRAGQEATVDSLIAEPLPSAMLGLARLVSVSFSDPDIGPHLVVARLKCSVTPHSFADDSTPNQVAYPAPGRSVGDYTADEFVLCCRVDGVCVALKLA